MPVKTSKALIQLLNMRESMNMVFPSEVFERDRSPDFALHRLRPPSRRSLSSGQWPRLIAYSYGVVADLHRSSRSSRSFRGYGWRWRFHLRLEIVYVMSWMKLL